MEKGREMKNLKSVVKYLCMNASVPSNGEMLEISILLKVSLSDFQKFHFRNNILKFYNSKRILDEDKFGRVLSSGRGPKIITDLASALLI